MFNLFKRKNNDLTVAASIATSCEDEAVHYADFPDGLRLIFRDGAYAGWYLPGEVQNDR